MGIELELFIVENDTAEMVIEAGKVEWEFVVMAVCKVGSSLLDESSETAEVTIALCRFAMITYPDFA